MYLDGESVKVVEHDVVGFRQQGGITLQGRVREERILGQGRFWTRGETEETLTDMFVSLLRMTWRR